MTILLRFEKRGGRKVMTKLNISSCVYSNSMD